MKQLIYITSIFFFLSCNTTSREEGVRQGADLQNRSCFDLGRDDCYRAAHCRYDSVSLSCLDINSPQGPYAFPTSCVSYTSEFNCPRNCRWTGYSCVDPTNSPFGNNQNDQCQFYNNDPYGCQAQGCVFQNGLCQMNQFNQMGPQQGGGLNCSVVFQSTTCVATPGCQWINNSCQNRY